MVQTLRVVQDIELKRKNTTAEFADEKLSLRSVDYER
jgi:hypothetical protein